MDYIHNNPVVEKWKLAEAAAEYKHSIAAYYLLNTINFDFITNYMEHI